MSDKNGSSAIKAVVITILACAVLGGMGFIWYQDKQEQRTVVEELQAALNAQETAPQVTETQVVQEVIAPLRKETLETMVESASELISAKYFYSNAADLDKYKAMFGHELPLTEEKTVFTYKGTINVIIDISKIEFEIDDEAKLVTVTMPYPQIGPHEIDHSSFQWYDVKKSAFTQIDPWEVTDRLDELKKVQEREVKADKDFMESVSKNAEQTLRGLFENLNTAKDYTFVFKTEAAPPEETETTTETVLEETTTTTVQSSIIAVPQSALSYRGDNYMEVQKSLTDAGFTNIVAEKTEKKWLNKANDVAQISINGKDDFKQNDEFAPDAIIRIYYYSE